MWKARCFVAELIFETASTLDTLHMALNRLGSRLLPPRHPAERSNAELDEVAAATNRTLHSFGAKEIG